MKANIVLLGVLGLAGFLSWAAQQTHRIQTEITIDAPPECVWQVITDTAQYPEWNPVIVRLEGHLQPGQTIEFENKSGSSSMVLRPTVLVADAGRELRWLGRLWVPRLFDGEHFFVLTRTQDGKTHLQHGENFRGILIPFTRSWLGGSVKGGFTRINAALKARAESGS